MIEDYVADFWPVRLNMNRIGKEIWTNHKTKKREKMIQFSIEPELLAKISATNKIH